MEHALRVLVRIDTKEASASIEVRGPLTELTCDSLMNILRHTSTLGADIRVNLARVGQVEPSALDRLQECAAQVEESAASGRAVSVRILNLPIAGFSAGFDAGSNPGPVSPGIAARTPLSPAPVTPALVPLTNEQAAELAFLRHDPRALLDPPVAGLRRQAPLSARGSSSR